MKIKDLKLGMELFGCLRRWDFADKLVVSYIGNTGGKNYAVCNGIYGDNNYLILLTDDDQIELLDKRD